MGRISADAGRTGALQSSPRTSAAGRPSAASPMASTADAATASANPTSVTSSGRPDRSCLAAPVPQRRHAGRADAEAHRAEPPRPPDAVGDDDADVGAEMRVQPLLEPPRAVVGRLRQQQHAPAVVLGAEVGLVDAGIGHHQAVAGGDDQHVGLGADHLGGLRQDRLHQPRVLPRDLRQLPRPLAGLDAARGPDTAPPPWRRSCSSPPARPARAAPCRRPPAPRSAGRPRSSPGSTRGMPSSAWMVSRISPNSKPPPRRVPPPHYADFPPLANAWGGVLRGASGSPARRDPSTYFASAPGVRCMSGPQKSFIQATLHSGWTASSRST